jgi:hypothetical protein
MCVYIYKRTYSSVHGELGEEYRAGNGDSGFRRGGSVRNIIIVLVLLLDRHGADAGHAGEHERADECSPG